MTDRLLTRDGRLEVVGCSNIAKGYNSKVICRLADDVPLNLPDYCTERGLEFSQENRVCMVEFRKQPGEYGLEVEDETRVHVGYEVKSLVDAAWN